MIFERFVPSMSVALALTVSCGASDEPAPLLWVGKVGDHLPASTTSNVFWVATGANGRPGPLSIVDTGAPVALFNVEAFDGAVAPGVGRLATLTLGQTILWKVPTVGITGDTSVAPNGGAAGGLVGFTVFGQFATSFDYRNREVVLGAAPRPSDLLPPISIPFVLEGGGVARVPQDRGLLDFPASRVNLTANIEGVRATLLLDTGASWVALRTARFAALTSDGRGEVTDEATLAEGDTMTRVTRLRSVSIGEAEVKDAAAAAAPRIDQLLDDLSAEVGRPVDGLLGAPFLREYYVAVDYPNRRLELHRYPTQAHVVDEYRRVGIDLRGFVGNGGISYVVARVFPGTDAERQRIMVGERLFAIDDAPLDSPDAWEVERRLLGPIGTSHRLTFVDRTLVVQVEELLPLP